MSTGQSYLQGPLVQSVQATGATKGGCCLQPLHTGPHGEKEHGWLNWLYSISLNSGFQVSWKLHSEQETYYSFPLYSQVSGTSQQHLDTGLRVISSPEGELNCCEIF